MHPPLLFEVCWLIFYSLQNLTKPAWQKNSGGCQKKVAGGAVLTPQESRWSQKTPVPRNRLRPRGKQRGHSSEQDTPPACPHAADILTVTSVSPGRRLNPSGPFLGDRGDPRGHGSKSHFHGRPSGPLESAPTLGKRWTKPSARMLPDAIVPTPRTYPQEAGKNVPTKT